MIRPGLALIATALLASCGADGAPVRPSLGLSLGIDSNGKIRPRTRVGVSNGTVSAGASSGGNVSVGASDGGSSVRADATGASVAVGF